MGNTALRKTETQNGKRMSSVANVVCEALEGGGGGEINTTADVLPSSIVGLVLRNFYLNVYKVKFSILVFKSFNSFFILNQLFKMYSCTLKNMDKYSHQIHIQGYTHA